MGNPSSVLKQEFLKRWIVGLRKCRFLRRNKNILERKKTIKLSADIAMASARNQTTRWSRAIIANATKDNTISKILVNQTLGSSSCTKTSLKPQISYKIERSRKILKRRGCGSRRIKRMSCRSMKSGERPCMAAKTVVNKRTKVLKSLVPGGEFMDDISLIEETLDYITSLRAQVDVMRCLAGAAELLYDHK